MRSSSSKLGEIDLVKMVKIEGRGRSLVSSQLLYGSQIILTDSPIILYSPYHLSSSLSLFLPPLLIVPTASSTYKLVPLPPSSPTFLALFSFVLSIASLASRPPNLPGLVIPYPFCRLLHLSPCPTAIAMFKLVSTSPRTISPLSLLPTSKFCFLFKASLSPPLTLMLPSSSIPSSLPFPLLQSLSDSSWSSPLLYSPRTSSMLTV